DGARQVPPRLLPREAELAEGQQLGAAGIALVGDVDEEVDVLVGLPEQAGGPARPPAPPLAPAPPPHPPPHPPPCTVSAPPASRRRGPGGTARGARRRAGWGPSGARARSGPCRGGGPAPIRWPGPAAPRTPARP